MSGQDRSPPWQRRVVLLGASNLTRGISSAVAAAWSLWGHPLQVLAAPGNGRSYGMTTRIFGRTLPGIAQCGLWKQLASEPELPTRALLTDIGNDILYGIPVDQIVAWIETCLDRLAAARAHVTVALPPVANVLRIGPVRYYGLRTVFYPNCRISRRQVLAQAEQLDIRLHEIARQRRLRTVRPLPSWYGLDPIHFKMRCWSLAWRAMLAEQTEPTDESPVRGSLARWLYLQSLVPEQRHLFGYCQRRRTPQGELGDGTTIAIF